jgi:hypothetical protein
MAMLDGVVLLTAVDAEFLGPSGSSPFPCLDSVFFHVRDCTKGTLIFIKDTMEEEEEKG